MAQQRQIPLQAGTHSPKLLIPLNLTLLSAKDKALGRRVLCDASSGTLTPTKTAEIRVAMGHTLPFPNLCWQLSVGPNMQTVITTHSCLLWVTYYHTGYRCLINSGLLCGDIKHPQVSTTWPQKEIRAPYTSHKWGHVYLHTQLQI